MCIRDRYIYCTERWIQKSPWHSCCGDRHEERLPCSLCLMPHLQASLDGHLPTVCFGVVTVPFDASPSRIWQWNQLPQELVSAPTLEAFKKSLDNHLANMLWLYSCIEQGVGLDGLVGLTSLFYDSMINLVISRPGPFLWLFSTFFLAGRLFLLLFPLFSFPFLWEHFICVNCSAAWSHTSVLCGSRLACQLIGRHTLR